MPPPPVPEAAPVTEAKMPPTTPPAPLRESEERFASSSARLPEAEGKVDSAEIVAEMEAELTAWNDLDPTATEPRSFEPQEALDVMDETADEFEEPLSGEAATTGETAPAEGEERRGRRRRRRRGRGRSREAAEATESAEGRSTEAGEEQPVEDYFGEGLDFEPSEAAEGEAEEEVRGERHAPPAERAGDRRRGRDREGPREEAFDEEEANEEFVPEFDESDEEESVHAGADEPGDFESDDELDDGAESPRIGFRNIPTWQDAIGVMIAKNMESRAKNPAGPRGRGRPGGRGRGRGRDRRPDRR